MAKTAIVIGAGVVGVTTAYSLWSRGYKVKVIERNSDVALECSHQNGGQLSYSQMEPLASFSNLLKVPSWIFKKDSPIIFGKGSTSKDFLKWGLGFVLSSSNSTNKKNTASMLSLSQYSRDVMHEVIEEAKLEFDYLQRGTLLVYSNKKDFDKAKKTAEFKKSLGIKSKILNKDGIIKQEPALEDSSYNFIGGVWYPNDESGDCFKFTKGLTAFLKKHGVEFVFNKEVDKLILNSDNTIKEVITIENKNNHDIISSFQADVFVISAGAYTPKVLDDLNIKTGIIPMRGHSIHIDIKWKDRIKNIRSTITEQHKKVVYTKLGDELRVGGIAEFAGFNHNIRKDKIDSLIKLTKSLTGLDEFENIKTWCCLRPQTYDGLPIISDTKYTNLYINSGHGMLGWTLATGSGELIANIIDNEELPLDRTPFSL